MLGNSQHLSLLYACVTSGKLPVQLQPDADHIPKSLFCKSEAKLSSSDAEILPPIPPKTIKHDKCELLDQYGQTSNEQPDEPPPRPPKIQYNQRNNTLSYPYCNYARL